MPASGVVSGAASALSMACNKLIWRTWRVCGYETVKIGSKMAARYNASTGEVKLEAMIEPSLGSLAFSFASCPFLTPSICKSIHQMPGKPNSVHSDAFLNRAPRGRC